MLRPKKTCELFGIVLKALHKLETSGRVMAVRIGPKKVQRRYSPVIGETDDRAGAPLGQAYSPDDLAASLFRNIGIDRDYGGSFC